jgi:hypothetical protein
MTFVRYLRFRSPAVFFSPALALSTLVTFMVTLNDPRAPALVVEIQSDASGVAQLFFDVGNGITERDSVAVPVGASNNFQTLRFLLPRRTIHALRLDPINTSATITLRRTRIIDAAGDPLLEFRGKDVAAVQQLTNRIDSADVVQFTTVPSANDPILSLALTEPLQADKWTSGRLLRVATRIAITVLLAALVAGAFSMLRGLLYRVSTLSVNVRLGVEWGGTLLDRTARSISDPAFLTFDRLAILCYLAVSALFVLSVLGGFHGSSISLHSTDGSIRPLMGTGKPIRSDEWAYHTPAILHQVYRAVPFDGEVSALGPDYAALISNVPTRHFTTLFRPQFWAFFFLPPAYAFSYYWQFKAALLLCGVFSLLMLLSRSSKIAAVGTLWYFFSPFTQWWYSWPSLLPEMIGSFCIVMCTVFYMSVGQRPLLLFLAALACLVGAVNFAMCAYIPHQIPLVWLGVFLCVWWLLAKREHIFTRRGVLMRSGVLCATWLAVCAVMIGFYRDAATALTTIANTVYPGQRTMPGGEYPVPLLLSNFFSLWMDDNRLPQICGQSVTCGGFLWLAPVTLIGLLTGRPKAAPLRSAYGVLSVFAALLVVWMFVPLPGAIGSLSFMNKSGIGRSTHVLGLVNVALVSLYLGMRSAQTEITGGIRRTVTLGLVVWAFVYVVFLWTNRHLADFLTSGELLEASGYTAIMAVAVLENRLGVVAAGVVLPLIMTVGLVNPMDRGLRAIESTALFQFMRSHPDLLAHRWIVYSARPIGGDALASVSRLGLFSAVGCQVMTGLKYVPDLRALRAFDPDGSQQELINRSVWLIAEPEFSGRRAAFQQVRSDMILLTVSPLDPALKQAGVRYAALPQPPPPEIAAQMRALSGNPIDGYWLYQLP